ncbi:MAG TPA: 50S ribosomal protein L21 [bacterium]|nr:50S ribosomal protein L21 [bacterium]
MYAIVEIAGKQYKITEGASINVDKLGDGKKEVTIDKILLLVTDKEVKIGNPTVSGVTITAQADSKEVKGPKVVVFKWKRRKGYRKKQGHRHKFTKLKINKIEVK